MTKKDSITRVVTEAKRCYGADALRFAGEPEPYKVIPISAAFDAATGIGGLPRGRIIEVFGPEGCGKTTLGLAACASVIRAGGVPAYIDLERSLDTKYARGCGVDLSRLLVSQPDDAEQALDIVDTLAQSGAVDLVVIDSAAALTPRGEAQGNIGDANHGLRDHLMSRALRKLAMSASRSECTLLFTNQLREKVGVMFGPSERTCAGSAMKYYASMRIELRTISTVKNPAETTLDDLDKRLPAIGRVSRAQFAKNKCAAPFTQAELTILAGKGIQP